MATVCFYGDLQRYGRRFNLEVHTAGEALRALIAQIPGLRQHLQPGYYRVRIAKNDLNDQTLNKGMSSLLPQQAVIHIVPQVAGAKSGGLFSVVIGAAMIGAAFATGGLSLTAWGASSWGLALSGLGSLATGVAAMLTKMPSTPTAGSSNNITNTAFSNLDNGIAQGAAIPLCYGEVRIGSKVLSQGLATE
jgi:predicted phage tail protein